MKIQFLKDIGILLECYKIIYIIFKIYLIYNYK